MGASQSGREHKFQDLADKTGFSIEQIKNLHSRFKYLTQDEDTLRREHLENVSNLSINPIRRQIIEAFFDERNLGGHEKGCLQEIGFEEFVTVLAFFRPPKPRIPDEEVKIIRKEKLRYNICVILSRNLGGHEKGCLQEIGFEEFVTVLAFFRPPKPRIPDEEVKIIRKEKLRFLFNMHDTDNDGVITLEEYRRVVEELLSSYETIGAETAKAISDGAMLEVASVTVGQMAPDEFYEGITFEQFMQILQNLEIETKMNIHFWNLDKTTMKCGK
ncbi:calcineurin B -like protein [Labeo rohita]|uniref:Calcineurin B homologous protein 3 n=1 Tax=Labeo rohita TaxID=84645 RepID=A0A498LK78_LABRO|nr:calcineurin B -like protein [Labeo rohita]